MDFQSLRSFPDSDLVTWIDLRTYAYKEPEGWSDVEENDVELNLPFVTGNIVDLISFAKCIPNNQNTDQKYLDAHSIFDLRHFNLTFINMNSVIWEV